MTANAHEGQLSGRVALVTNADQGVGAAVALALASAGAEVIVTVAVATPEPSVINEIKQQGMHLSVRDLPRKVDGTDAARLVRNIIGQFGQLDIMVVNAEQRCHWQVDDVDLDEAMLDEQFAVNVTSCISLVREAVRSMSKGGRVVAIGASLADRIGTPGLADFAATKAAIAAFCRGAAQDLGPRAITVNVVQMGAIDYGNGYHSAEILEAERESNVLKRLGTPEEVANAVLFLAGPDASFITGSVLNVDGGYNA